MKVCNKNCFECPYDDCLLEITDHELVGFSERLQQIINKRGISKKEIAKRTGISQTTLCFYTNGSRNPSCMQIVNLCRVLNCSADWLLGIRGEHDR